MNILLDYFFPISVITPTQAASTAFLKQACLVVAPKAGVTIDEPTLCTSMAEVAALTDNTEAEEFFNAGMTRIYILPTPSLQIAAKIVEHQFDFFTILISSDFDEINIAGIEPEPGEKAAKTISGVTFEAIAEGLAGNDISIEYTSGAGAGLAVVSVAGDKITVQIDSGVTTNETIVTQVNTHVQASIMVAASTTAPLATNVVQAETSLEGGVDPIVGIPGIDVGTFKGVIGVSSNDINFLRAQATIENRCAFYTSGSNGAKNMVFAFGKLLSNSANWTNQQFITMPYADNINTVGAAQNLFDDKISFVLNDDQYGKRLGLFAAGMKAIAAPYIVRNLMIDLQSKALQYISGNQPSYTVKHATLMEDELQKVIDGDEQSPGYVGRGWIEDGKVSIKLEQNDFVANGYINIAPPGALWRIVGEMRQSL